MTPSHGSSIGVANAPKTLSFAACGAAVALPPISAATTPIAASRKTRGKAVRLVIWASSSSELGKLDNPRSRRDRCQDGRRGRGATPLLVRRAGPRLALAAHARPIRDPRLRGDAPADAGLARRPALPEVARPPAGRAGALVRVDRRCDPRLAGARLQPARGQPAPRVAACRRAWLAG